jgi:hypothetical protein
MACASWFFHNRDLVRVHSAGAADRNIFSDGKALRPKLETNFIVNVAFGVVKVPLPAGLSAQEANAVVCARPEMPDPACLLMVLPFSRVQMPVMVQRDKQIVAFIARSRRMALLPRKQEPDMSELRCDFRRFGHFLMPRLFA